MFHDTQYKTYDEFVLAFKSWLQSKIADPDCTEAHAYINNSHLILYRPRFHDYLDTVNEIIAEELTND